MPRLTKGRTLTLPQPLSHPSKPPQDPHQATVWTTFNLVKQGAGRERLRKTKFAPASVCPRRVTVQTAVAIDQRGVAKYSLPQSVAHRGLTANALPSELTYRYVTIYLRPCLVSDRESSVIAVATGEAYPDGATVVKILRASSFLLVKRVTRRLKDVSRTT